jgi:hypothetical protein
MITYQRNIHWIWRLYYRYDVRLHLITIMVASKGTPRPMEEKVAVLATRAGQSPFSSPHVSDVYRKSPSNP